MGQTTATKQPKFIPYNEWATQNPEQAEATKECPRCDGAGSVKCCKCGGTMKRECRECGAEKDCDDCEAYRGLEPCWQCNETGEMEIGRELYNQDCQRDLKKWKEFHGGK